MNHDTQAAQQMVAQEKGTLGDLATGYPANHFAWRMVRERAQETGARSLVEVGVGSGNGVPHVVSSGMDFAGFDRDPACVDVTRTVAVKCGIDPAAVIVADVEDPASVSALPGAGTFDQLMALGIMPHVGDRAAALRTMSTLVRPGGELFLEVRNSLFSLFTANRFTRDFIVDELLADVPVAMKERTSEFIEPRVMMDRPPAGATLESYANPLEVPQWLARLGYADVSIHPFHFHATLPALESADPQAFRDESLALEEDASGWRGLFLCSAFLVRVGISRVGIN